MNQGNSTFAFINYRRDDCPDDARVIWAEVQKAFGRDAAIFFDQHDIRLTEDWKQTLHAALRSAEVLLAIIGPRWEAGFRDKQQQAATDWVLYEIETALRERIDIIPVFVDRDGKPDSQGLPDAAAALIERQGFNVKRGQLAAAIDQLIGSLKVLRGDSPPAESVAPQRTLPLLACLPLPERYATEQLYATDDRGQPLITQPFLGPTYFHEHHAALYFGRDQAIRQLFHGLRRHRLTLLHGYSGSGKSSLLHAGLLPRLKALPEWSVAEPIVRRNKQAGGLHRQLEDLLRQLPAPLGPGRRRVILLDQVEEMYTDPLADEEIQPLGRLLGQTLQAHPDLHLVLCYRSEYDAKIRQEFVPRYGLTKSVDAMYLGPLDATGLAGAILGPMAFTFKFNYQIAPGLAEKIAADFTGDDFSPQAVLLQARLVELWTAASQAAEDQNRQAIRITPELYAQHPKKDLDTFVEERLRELLTDEHWAAAEAGGLLLSMLHDFTTPMGTATSLRDDAFCARYRHVAQPAPAAMLQAFKRVYLLSNTGRAAGVTRMTHDTLARIVRRLYDESDRPGQKAWRILAPKLKDLAHSEFSELDVDTILAGAPGMPALDASAEAKLLADQQHYRQQRLKNFQLAYSTALRNLEHLEHAQALDNLQLAAQENLEPEALRQTALELLYALLLPEQPEETARCLRLLETLQDAAFALPPLPEGTEAARRWLERDYPDLCARLHARYFPTLTTVPGGTYEMGSEEGYDDEKPVHPVTVSGFRMADTPVTCWQFGLFCLASGRALPRDSGFGRGDKPVVNVNWYEALEYCNWLSRREGLGEVYDAIGGDTVQADHTRNGYRLPTEAEWEFAARAVRNDDGTARGGGAVRFGNGRDTARAGEINFDASHAYNTQAYVEKGEMRGETTPVRTFDPNPLGLYDMSGNVFEWCWDRWSEGDDHYYKVSADATDPAGPENGPYRMGRGGSWINYALGCRCSYRVRYYPFIQFNVIGFRVVRRL